MLASPKKRICPSLSFIARSNTPRHAVGLKNGSKPSATSISANAPSSTSQNPAAAKTYFLAAGAAAGAAVPRMALKNSLLGSTTITSPLLRKLER
jgi:hypothetical protein